MRWGLFPALVVAAGTALVSARLSGSSIGVLAASQPAPGLLWGTPRAVRSDEYLLVTPSRLSSTFQGFMPDPWVGLAPTDLDVAVHSGVSTDWTSLLHPDSWGFLLGGAEIGLAFSWWWSFIVSLLGVYAFLGLLTRRPLLSALLSVAATFTPYSAWWSAAPPSLLLGYAAGAGACFIAAWRVRRGWSAAALGVAAGVLGAMLALVLYPPWAISLGIVVALVCVGIQLDERHSWRRVGWTLALALGVAGTILVIWWLQNSSAIAAMTGTHYPGSRVTHAGEMALYQLVNAPLNFWTATGPGETVGASGEFANLSGVASSWMPLPVIALLVWGTAELAFRKFRARRAAGPAQAEGAAEEGKGEPELVWSLIGAALAAILLLLWSVTPLPDWVGSVTLLNKVQDSRTPLALGFAVIVMVALAAACRSRRTVRVWTPSWAVCAGVATATTALWAQYHMPWDSSLVSSAGVLASGFALGVLMALIFSARGAQLWAALFALYAAASWVVVNPLQLGTGPLTEDPLTVALRAETTQTSNPRTLVFSDFRSVAMVRAAGLQSVSGQTPIPSADVMNQILPAEEEQWNNYVKYFWVQAPAGSPTELRGASGSTLRLTIDPCSADMLDAVDPGWAVANDPITGSCWREVATVARPDGGLFHIYRSAR